MTLHAELLAMLELDAYLDGWAIPEVATSPVVTRPIGQGWLRRPDTKMEPTTTVRQEAAP